MKQLKYKDIIEHLDNVLKFNCGKARCYLGYEVYDTVITWEKGERFPTENIVPGTDFGNIKDEQMPKMMTRIMLSYQADYISRSITK